MKMANARAPYATRTHVGVGSQRRARGPRNTSSRIDYVHRPALIKPQQPAARRPPDATAQSVAAHTRRSAYQTVGQCFTRHSVPKTGLEPVRPCGRRILNPLRLPIPPLRRSNEGRKASRFSRRSPPPTHSFRRSPAPAPDAAGRRSERTTASAKTSRRGRPVYFVARGRIGAHSRRLSSSSLMSRPRSLKLSTFCSPSSWRCATKMMARPRSLYPSWTMAFFNQ